MHKVAVVHELQIAQPGSMAERRHLDVIKEFMSDDEIIPKMY